MDAIEGEGTNYIRENIEVRRADGEKLIALTYVVKNRKEGLRTSLAYVKHIIVGLKEHELPGDYCRYVFSRVIENNSQLRQELFLLVSHFKKPTLGLDFHLW